MTPLQLTFENALCEKALLFSKNLVRYRQRAKYLSELFLDPHGELKLDALQKYIEEDTPSRSGYIIQEIHLKKIAEKLWKDRDFQKKFQSFDFPIEEDFQELLILQLDHLSGLLNKRDLRKAVLQALFGFLRQTVGSCFATAPCLYVLDRHPEYFLSDLYELSKKGALQRIIHGTSFKVPMAKSVGKHFLKTKFSSDFLQDSLFSHFIKENKIALDVTKGSLLEEVIGIQNGLRLQALAHDPLLKIWEYTMASFCDVKGEFSETTLYISLGLDQTIPDGLGAFFESLYQKKLDEKSHILQQAAEDAYLSHQRLVMAESMAKNATTESGLNRAKSEIISANFELNARELDMEDLKKEQNKIQHLYQRQAELFKELLPHFFQESYDPDLVNDHQKNDDAKAGFRLFVKDNQLKSRFKAISNHHEFSSALKAFFELWEKEILKEAETKKESSFISDCITQTIQLTSSKEFLEKMMQWAKNRHPDALPWAYVSGGTLETLLKTYFRKEILTYKKIVSDHVLMFFVELLEYFKALPEKDLQPFREDASLSLLIETTTHACQLHPGFFRFRHFWESTDFTYTQVRDELIEEAKNFYQKQAPKLLLPKDFFQRFNLDAEEMHLDVFLNQYANHPQAFFIASSFICHSFDEITAHKYLGACPIGDTNWSYEKLFIAYDPFTQKLAFFAQEPNTLGLVKISAFNQTPIQWKIYENLFKQDSMVYGIKI